MHSQLRLVRLMIRDRLAARASVAAILRRGFDVIVSAPRAP